MGILYKAHIVKNLTILLPYTEVNRDKIGKILKILLNNTVSYFYETVNDNVRLNTFWKVFLLKGYFT